MAVSPSETGGDLPERKKTPITQEPRAPFEGLDPNETLHLNDPRAAIGDLLSKVLDINGVETTPTITEHEIRTRQLAENYLQTVEEIYEGLDASFPEERRQQAQNVLRIMRLATKVGLHKWYQEGDEAFRTRIQQTLGQASTLCLQLFDENATAQETGLEEFFSLSFGIQYDKPTEKIERTHIVLNRLRSIEAETEILQLVAHEQGILEELKELLNDSNRDIRFLITENSDMSKKQVSNAETVRDRHANRVLERHKAWGDKKISIYNEVVIPPVVKILALMMSIPTERKNDERYVAALRELTANISTNLEMSREKTERDYQIDCLVRVTPAFAYRKIQTSSDLRRVVQESCTKLDPKILETLVELLEAPQPASRDFAMKYLSALEKSSEDIDARVGRGMQIDTSAETILALTEQLKRARLECSEWIISKVRIQSSDEFLWHVGKLQAAGKVHDEDNKAILRLQSFLEQQGSKATPGMLHLGNMMLAAIDRKAAYDLWYLREIEGMSDEEMAEISREVKIPALTATTTRTRRQPASTDPDKRKATQRIMSTNTFAIMNANHLEMTIKSLLGSKIAEGSPVHKALLRILQELSTKEDKKGTRAQGPEGTGLKELAGKLIAFVKKEDSFGVSSVLESLEKTSDITTFALLIKIRTSKDLQNFIDRVALNPPSNWSEADTQSIKKCRSYLEYGETLLSASPDNKQLEMRIKRGLLSIMTLIFNLLHTSAEKKLQEKFKNLTREMISQIEVQARGMEDGAATSDSSKIHLALRQLGKGNNANGAEGIIAAANARDLGELKKSQQAAAAAEAAQASNSTEVTFFHPGLGIGALTEDLFDGFDE